MTGEGTCSACGERVLRVREIASGRLVTLEAARTDGGWMPEAGVSGMVVAMYHAPGKLRDRDGHHAHDLRCQNEMLRRSRARIADATTETVVLPVVNQAGLRALVGASS